MALNYGYFNSVGGDRKYDAETMSSYFSGIISKGVLQNYANKFQVLAGSGMTVRVSTGKAYFTNGQWVENDAIINLTLDISSSLLSRIDRIVLRRDNSDSARNVSIVIKTEDSIIKKIKKFVLIPSEMESINIKLNEELKSDIFVEVIDNE